MIKAANVVGQLPMTECENESNAFDVKTATRYPTTTGASIIGIKFNDGVMIAADTLASYGSLARYKNCPRVMKVNESTMVACMGDYADFQYIMDLINQKVLDDECLDDGFHLKPKSWYSWLTRVMYKRRTQFDPLWCTIIVAGMQDGEPFLACVDKIGVAYEDCCIGAGLGGFYSTAQMREALDKNPNLDKDEAKKVLGDCLRILYYRDCRASSKYTMGIVTKDSCEVTSPAVIDSSWSVAQYIHGY